MRLWSLGFLLGITSLQFFTSILSIWMGFFSLAMAAILAFSQLKKHSTIFIAAFLGFLCITLNFYFQFSNRKILDEIESKNIIANGIIDSLPEKKGQKTRFEFKVNSVEFTGKIYYTPIRVRLSWFKAPENLQVGDEINLEIKVKKPRSTLNFGGFDYEKWLFQQNIHAVGYVLPKGKNIFLKKAGHIHTVQKIRKHLDLMIPKHLISESMAGMIMGLTIGSRRLITAEQWKIMQGTGTNHLMAISGLHIGLVAGFAFFIASFLWRCSHKLILLIPVPQMAAFCSLFTAFLYSGLAGFSLPTQRAVLMIAIFLLGILLRKNVPPWQAWCFSLLTILVLNPFSSLSDSFWLSFGAVAIIIYGVSGRIYPKSLWWKWGRTQWVVTLGLLPMTLLFFHQISWIGFIANLIAIPWVGFIVLPLSLLGSLFLLFLPSIGHWVLKLAEISLECLWSMLSLLASLPHVQWNFYFPNMLFLLAVTIGALLLLAPRGIPGKWLGVFWIIPLFLWKPSTPKVGEIWMTLLDVGQGLSTVIRTQHHILLYDTGVRYDKEFDMGQAVIIPFLRASGIKKIDQLVISHGDNDHIGGANSILKVIPIKKISTSVPERFPGNNVISCQKGQKWEWDGTVFEFLYPPPQLQNRGNNSSCVLRITHGQHRILLTGDIEKESERYLLQNHEKLKADILIVPHHGSRTSSTLEFVNAVKPLYALFTTGYKNRYHFPHAVVEDRYRKAGSILLDTSKVGSISFILKKNKKIEEPIIYRIEQWRYWYS